MIVEVFTGANIPAGAIDCAGEYVAPGLVELHTDHLEQHMSPRPGVDWPHAAAILAHDAGFSGAGVTMVFDAMRVGSSSSDKRKYKKYARQMADESLALRKQGALRISHYFHLRAEICSETLIEEMAEFGPDDRIDIVSLMDHMGASVISCCHTPPVFEPAEHVFDLMTLFIQGFAVSIWKVSAPSGWDAGRYCFGNQSGAKFIAVIALVTNQT